MSRYFIAHDPHDDLAVRWARWAAAHLPADSAEAVLPLKTWSLGAWELPLEQCLEGATGHIVILTPGFLRSPEAFVRYQRRALLQRPVSSDQ
jgi:hypothetical protein